MLCASSAGRGGWRTALQAAKSWIPAGHSSSSMLYLCACLHPLNSGSYSAKQSPYTSDWCTRGTVTPHPSCIPDAFPTYVAWLANYTCRYDGATSELFDETFATWNEATVGYGSHAVIFGPQFGSFHGSSGWKYSLGLMRRAMQRDSPPLSK